jgi:LmbE family N-acetylglucosaminyl deacetylase
MFINSAILNCKNGEILNILELDIPEGVKVLSLAPHSDDFDVNAITLKHFQRAGADIRLDVLCLDNGVEADFEPQTPQAQIRKREQLASLAFFALPAERVNFIDTVCDETGQTIYHPGNKAIIEDSIRKFSPDIILTPHPNDSNSAHRAVTGMLYEIELKKGTVIMHNHDPKTFTIKPNAFMPFDSAQAQWKAELLRHHKSQHSRNLKTRGYGFDDRLLNVNRDDAKDHNLGCEYAELFEVRVI